MQLEIPPPATRVNLRPVTLLSFANALRGRASVARQFRGQNFLPRPGCWSARIAKILSASLWIGGLAAALLITDSGASGAREATSSAPAQETGEYDLKAQFLLRFATPYVTWPEAAFENPTAPFVVAILGKDPFGKSLDKQLKGKKVGNHPIKIVHYASIEELDLCQILFMPEAQEKQLKKITEFYKKESTLIVAESIAAAESGAQVGFYLEKMPTGSFGVRFAINANAAKKVKLDMSSELLKLAKIVETKTEREQ